MTSIHAVYAAFGGRYRRRRNELFVQMMDPKSDEVVLDVGGTSGYWNGLTTSESLQVVLLNVDEAKRQDGLHDFHWIRGSGCDLPFGDGSFSIAFSNSVIEHVGTLEHQQQFAAEVRRMAPRLWVQTPARECPVEPHYLALFVHWLPAKLQRPLLRWVSIWGWVQRPSPDYIDCMVRETRLLSGREFRALFPDCEVLTERLFGIFPKSYIAVRGLES